MLHPDQGSDIYFILIVMISAIYFFPSGHSESAFTDLSILVYGGYSSWHNPVDYPRLGPALLSQWYRRIEVPQRDLSDWRVSLATEYLNFGRLLRHIYEWGTQLWTHDVLSDFISGWNTNVIQCERLCPELPSFLTQGVTRARLGYCWAKGRYILDR